ncbi:MAG TPA: arabinofuranosidase catalytic domain-containing protein, partial [Pseudonocardiaceae bacterium]
MIGLATAQAATAATQKPCDIYASGGTPCSAAYSTTRAMFASYGGPLYQIQRASDNSTLNIGLASAGGVVNSAPQVSFCSGT